MLTVAQRSGVGITLTSVGAAGIRAIMSGSAPKFIAGLWLQLFGLASTISLIVGPLLLLWVIVELGWRYFTKPKSMRFVFPNDVGNLDSKITLFRESYTMLPDGQPIKTPLTLQRFYIGVENLTNKTLRNVRLVIESVTIPLRPAELHCHAKRNGEPAIDIQPKSVEYFLFGEGYDASDGAGVIIRQPDEIDAIAKHAAVAPFFLGTVTGGPHPLLKNDGYIVSFSAYADDVAPITAEAILNTKQRIELRLKLSPSVYSPA